MPPRAKWLRNPVDKGERISAREGLAALLTIARGRVRVVEMQALVKEIVFEISRADALVGALPADRGRLVEV